MHPHGEAPPGYRLLSHRLCARPHRRPRSGGRSRGSRRNPRSGRSRACCHGRALPAPGSRGDGGIQKSGQRRRPARRQGASRRSSPWRYGSRHRRPAGKARIRCAEHPSAWPGDRPASQDGYSGASRHLGRAAGARHRPSPHGQGKCRSLQCGRRCQNPWRRVCQPSPRGSSVTRRPSPEKSMVTSSRQSGR